MIVVETKYIDCCTSAFPPRDLAALWQRRSCEGSQSSRWSFFRRVKSGATGRGYWSMKAFHLSSKSSEPQFSFLTLQSSMQPHISFCTRLYQALYPTFFKRYFLVRAFSFIYFYLNIVSSSLSMNSWTLSDNFWLVLHSSNQHVRIMLSRVGLSQCN